MNHKAGFVNIVGSPNVGKSTLMNTLVGNKLSIITSKAQTTRQRTMGMVNSDEFQIVFSDTPGIIQPKYKLQESMVRYITAALGDADILLYMTDIKDHPDRNEDFIKKIADIHIPVLLVINKIDLSDEKTVLELSKTWETVLPSAELYLISALKKFNTEVLLKRIVTLLPEHPPYYPKDQITDRSERFLASEMIREKILLFYRQEIPYSVQIEIENFKEENKLIRISALIFVTRESQKAILIGKGGTSLKKAATSARLDMEKFFEKKIFLELFIKVKKDWRNNERLLKEWGYSS